MFQFISKREYETKIDCCKTADRMKMKQKRLETKDMETAVIFARVSSSGDRQTTERQILDLTDYADRNGIQVEQIYEERISGAKKNYERPVLQECLAYCVENSVSILLLSELSRLGRNVDEVLANIRFAKDNHLNIYFQKEGISIYGSDGKENPYLTIMIAVLGTCAQMERESIHYRLQSGRKVYVDKNLAETGKSGLGRKEGYRKPVETKKEEYKEVLKLLKAGYPIRKVAKLSDVSESTIKRLKKEFAI
jgi:DNA invertase Pin-like site-specific DNA recombinase